MSILIDLEGYELTTEESRLLRHPVCSGVVVFSRNYQNPDQLRQLTAAIRCVNPSAIIAADQEGGRVQRFREGFTDLPSMAYWGKRYREDQQDCIRQLSQTLYTMSNELHRAGINVNLMPVLDLNHGISEVIGERSLNSDPNIVAELGGLIIDELHRHHFPAVGKHFPGHGAVIADSHKALPVDDRDWNVLWHKDLLPFVALANQLDAIMPGHLVFSAMDNKPAGFSSFWLKEVLRNQLGFQGLIISDDLSMNAAAIFGNYRERARQALLAGCDLLLVCNNRSGAIEALSALSEMDRHQSVQKLTVFIHKFIRKSPV